jgi:hypothetical protein
MGSREWALTSDTPGIDAGTSDDQAVMSIRTGFRDDNRAELDDVSDAISISAAAQRSGSPPVQRDSLPVTGVGDSTVRKLEDHKQLVLQKACRRTRKSSSGANRCLYIGFVIRRSILTEAWSSWLAIKNRAERVWGMRPPEKGVQTGKKTKQRG